MDPCCEFAAVYEKKRKFLAERNLQSVELAKVPRAPLERGKGKIKNKSKFDDKGKEDVKNTPLYDYQEGSVHDLALRADILRGYEQFKVNNANLSVAAPTNLVTQLTHGSFTTILSTIGQEALELQLERFFTVWAWSWNLEEDAEFGKHLGIVLTFYPYRSLSELFQAFQCILHIAHCYLVLSITRSIYPTMSHQSSSSLHTLCLHRNTFQPITPHHFLCIFLA